MKNPILKIILAIILIMNFCSSIHAAREEPKYLKLTEVDKNTFNEYWYRITQQAFRLRERFRIDSTIDAEAARRIITLAETWYNYLPDNLQNESFLSVLKTELQNWINNPNSEANYTLIIEALSNFIDDSDISSITWKIEAFPSEWNAPLTVTLKWIVKDPSWSNLLDYNYTWWLDVWWKRKVIWNKPTLKYTFTREWNITVFLEVKSNHRNRNWKIDVLPFKSSTIINVKSKIASVIVNINWKSLKDQNIIKFEPLESSYWLIFDATSSTPTQWTEFSKTTWDFWNWTKKSYKWRPKIERIAYSVEWDFDVTLELETNQWKIVEKEFQISIHKPIASINSSQEEWFLWDKFIFSAKSSWKDKTIIYNWEVIDIENDKVILRKIWKIFNYEFTDKWRFNIKLKVKNASWETDIDNKIIYINSKSPVANFTTSVPEQSKPNNIFFDWSKSYDPDFTDDWNLKYYWIINWKRIELNKSNDSWSTGYYKFNSKWEHSISLEVRDNDWISNIKKWTVNVKSILSVDFNPFPKVIKRNWFIKFISTSPEAKIYEWDYWDGDSEWWNKKSTTHYFEKSGSFEVKLKVRDKKDNENSVSKIVYVWESDEPLAIIDIEPLSAWTNQSKSTLFEEKQCESNWKKEWAYIINRTSSINMKGSNSINLDWKNTWLKYSWKLDNWKLFSETNITYKYDEIWCHKVKLTVTSENDWKSNSTYTWLNVVNLKPTFKSLSLVVKDETSDPIIVTATAIWATDLDWVIQSYLWYYYTDSDTQPQWFRATRLNSTTFVLPKIAWNYHFILIMKDNNEGKTESLKWENSITLSWDNINTPLINVIVNDTSISTWQEIVFSTSVENIIWDNLTNKATYSWDYDWDGFYDVETSKSTVTYKYKKSWEFHAKVKVKYKWFSNVKSVTINVENKLAANFQYISIWNKYIFFNNSNWSITSIVWDMWNWDKIRWRNNFIYTYKDKETSHKVKLNISEWSKSSSKEKRIEKNIKNILKSRKKWINLFSIPQLGENKSIILKNQTDNLFLYLWESRWDYEYYPVDFDINYDSDLNWWKDDDEDNKWEESYSSWAPLKVPLNNKKEQNIRLFFKGSEQEVIDTIDIKIIKEYIKEKPALPEEEVKDFIASNEEKEIVSELKELIWLLPEENKEKAFSYIVRIQNEWNDSTEKTRTIIEFEEYLSTIQSGQIDEIIDLLETLLLEDDGDTNNINYNALRDLLPKSISCQEYWEFPSCYEYILDKLEQINSSNDVEINKKLWWEILNIISKQSEDIITVKQWYDFKAILKSLIYWWATEIPLCEEWQKEDDNCRIPPKETCKEWEENDNCIIPPKQADEGWSLLWTIWKWIIILIFIALWWVFIFFIYYKLTNKDNSWDFEDFIMEKTNPWDEKEIDVLWWMDDKKEKKVNTKNDNILNNTDKTLNSSVWKNNDIFSNNKTKEEKTSDKNKENLPSKAKKDEKVPSWLNLENWDNTKNKTVQKEDIFSWIDKTTKNNKTIWVDNKKTVNKPKDNNTEIKKDNKVGTSKEKKEDIFEGIEKDNTPDWLKGSFSETNKKDKQIEKKVENKKEDTPEWLKNDTKKSNKTNKTKEKDTPSEKKVDNKKEKTPDWLKNNKPEDNKIDSNKVIEKTITTEKTIISEKKVEVNKDNTPDWLKESFPLKEKEGNKETNKIKTNTKSEEKKPDLLKKEALNNNKTETVDKKIEVNIKNDLTTEKKAENLNNDKKAIEKNIIEVKKDNITNKEIKNKDDTISSTKNTKSDSNKENIANEIDLFSDNIIEVKKDKAIKSNDKTDKKDETKDDTPDWLKNEHFKVKEKKESWKSINWKSVDIPDWLSWDKLDNKEIEKNEIKLTTPSELKNKEKDWKDKASNTKEEDKPKNVKNIKNKTLEIDLTPDIDNKEDKKTITKDNTYKNNEKKNDDMELWDDWMKVPDWLKTNDDK